MKRKKINCKWCGVGHAPSNDGYHWIVKSVWPTKIDIRECAFEKHVEESGPKLIGWDVGSKDMSAEVEGGIGEDGKLTIDNIRTWGHELKLKANR